MLPGYAAFHHGSARRSVLRLLNLTSFGWAKQQQIEESGRRGGEDPPSTIREAVLAFAQQQGDEQLVRAVARLLPNRDEPVAEASGWQPWWILAG